MIQRVLLTLAILIMALPLLSQKMTVEKMEPLPMDTYASTHKRLDLNGNACAVVRVSLTVCGATFSGNVVGEVARDGSDYLVYMPQGSKKLWVKHPNYHELEVTFGDYGIDRLQSLTSYRISVSIPQTFIAQKKQTLNIKVTPPDAMVLIDDEMVEGSSVTLTVGSHKFNVAAKGYESQSGMIDVPENRPAKLTVELDRKASASQTVTQASTNPMQTVEQPTPTVQHQPVYINTPSAPSSKIFTVNGVSFTMMPVEGGTFTMGATPEMGKPEKDEKPAHQVALSSYYIGETEVTQELWKAVM